MRVLDFTRLSSDHLNSKRGSLPSKMHINDDQGYGEIIVTGDDAETFLNGQLSADISHLTQNACVTAALCNPQGRVLAVLEVLRSVLHDDQHFHLVTRTSLLETTVQHLKKYVLRSKVNIKICTRRILASTYEHTVIQSQQGEVNDNQILLKPLWAARAAPPWCLTSVVTPEPDALSINWQQAHVLLGLGMPNDVTNAKYIPQALGLGDLEAISYDKGCYTGQEIIARVHHRGRVNRQLKRYLSLAPLNVTYGEIIHNQKGDAAGEVVEYAHDDKGHLGVLAVIKRAFENQTLELQSSAGLLEPWPIASV